MHPLSRSLLLIALPMPVWAQLASTNDEFIQNWRTSREFTIAVAELMPEEKYAFRPNPEQMTFGGLMIHIASSQAVRFSQIGGVRPPAFRIHERMTKAEIIQVLRQSFDFSIALLPKFTAQQMAKSYQVDWYGRPEVTGRQLVLGMFNHTTHHRGQAEVYLRAAGIKPPDYRF
ncbi:MAG: DinB family protein [Acidobacteria bacterium]|nr:DinB family protein [Acidobacteriota bacterium]